MHSYHKDVSLPPELLSVMETAKGTEEALAWFDRQVLLLQRHKRDFIERQNLATPISKLPVETLSEIFQYLTPPFPAREEDGFVWLGFTHVCKRWRQVALNNPFLWTHPLVEYPQLAETMLHRAGNRPLSISLDTTDMRSHSKVDRIISLINRGYDILRLELVVSHADWYCIRRALVDRSGLVLQHLQVSLTDVDFSPSLPHRHVPPITAPQLRYLSMRNVVFPLQPQPLTCLTSLLLHDVCIHFSSGRGLTFPVLIQLISAPSLVRVELGCTSSPPDPHIPGEHPGKSITMTNLCSLTISDKPGWLILKLIPRLVLPSLLRLKLDIQLSDQTVSTAQEMESILDALVQILSRCQHSKPHLLAVSIDPIMHVDYVRVYHFHLTLSTKPTALGTSGQQLEIELDCHLTTTYTLMFLLRVRQLLPLENVVSLALNIRDDNAKEENIWEIFSSLPSVSHLSTGSSVYDLACVLNPHITLPTQNQGPAVFSGVSLITFEGPIQSLAPLREALFQRLKLGVPLPRLIFKSCTCMDEKDMDKFIEMLPGIQYEIDSNRSRC